MSGCAIGESQFYDGSWMLILPELLALPKIKRNGPNGAENAAQFIYKILSNSGNVQYHELYPDFKDKNFLSQTYKLHSLK